MNQQLFECCGFFCVIAEDDSARETNTMRCRTTSEVKDTINKYVTPLKMKTGRRKLCVIIAYKCFDSSTLPLFLCE